MKTSYLRMGLKDKKYRQILQISDRSKTITDCIELMSEEDEQRHIWLRPTEN